MLGYGYDPSLSEGSVKPPVFLTSTFVFQTAEQGRDFFDYLSGRRAPPVDGQPGLVYSRFNHPNLEIVEDRLAIHEKAASGLVFASGMAAIVTLMLAYVRPGETVLHSRPAYGLDESLRPRRRRTVAVSGVIRSPCPGRHSFATGKPRIKIAFEACRRLGAFNHD
jgi:methionine-gamma-lyase